MMTPEDRCLEVLGKKYSLGTEAISGWKVEKFSDGTCEAVRDYNHGTIKLDTITLTGSASYNMYRSGGQAFPTAPTGISGVVMVAEVIVSYLEGESTMWLGASRAGNAVLFANNSSAITVKDVVIRYRLSGRWK